MSTPILAPLAPHLDLLAYALERGITAERCAEYAWRVGRPDARNYAVLSDGGELTCTCPAGLQGLPCPHAELVAVLIASGAVPVPERATCTRCSETHRPRPISLRLADEIAPSGHDEREWADLPL